MDFPDFGQKFRKFSDTVYRSNLPGSSNCRQFAEHHFLITRIQNAAYFKCPSTAGPPNNNPITFHFPFHLQVMASLTCLQQNYLLLQLNHLRLLLLLQSKQDSISLIYCITDFLHRQLIMALVYAN